MRHAPTKVVTDLSLKSMTPDMAKTAFNMRFGAYDGTAANDIATMGGTEEIENEFLPEGANACVGAYQVNDGTGIMFAVWNENGDHSFYFLEFSREFVEINIQQIEVPNLNFKQDHYPLLSDYQEDYNVCIQEIDGQLYWCDGPNEQPKKINWKRTYTSNLEAQWETSRITRQPASPLRIEFMDTDTDPQSLSDNAFDNNDVPLVPFQWSYTYVRDDNEESRGGPYTQVVWSKDMRLYLPDSEVENYLLVNDTTVNNLIKQVNFYYRIGNNGPWLFYDLILNDITNYVDESGTPRLYLPIDDLRFIEGNASINDPFLQVFDAVPLYVRDSKLAQNRLFDANFIEDYDPVSTITVTPSLVAMDDTDPIDDQTQERRCLHPTDYYLVSVIPLDFAGRRTGTATTVKVQVPLPGYKRFGTASPFAVWTTDPDISTYFTLNDTNPEAYKLEVSIGGSVPSWCETVQVCFSKSKSTGTFLRTNAFMWLWGQKDGVDYATFAKVDNPTYPATYVVPTGGVSYKGICFELGSGEPFNFDANENQYIRIIGTVYDTDIFNNVSTDFDSINYENSDEFEVSTEPYGYKIVAQEGSRIFVELNAAQIEQFKKGLWFYETTPDEDGMASLNKSYIVDIFTVPTATEDTFYQVYDTILTAEEVSDTTVVTYYGDSFLKNANKSFSVGGVYNLIGETGNVLGQSEFMYPSFSWIQFQICTSLQAAFNTNWDSDFGQPNFKNINQKQTIRQNEFQWSGQYIPGTSVNGLSSVNPLDRKLMPLEQGPINCLMVAVSAQSAASVLLAYCINGVQSNYLGVAQTVDVSGTVVWSATTNVVGQSQPLRGPYGSNRAKQVVSTKNSEVYHYCPAFRDLIQYALDGLNRLGQQNLFLNAMKLLTDVGKICIGFDPSIQEVVLSDTNQQGVAYNPLYKSFQGFRAYYNTDRFCFVEDTMFSWKDGVCWIHRPNNPNRATIYGVQYDSSMELVSNVEPDKMKQWEQMVLDGDLFTQTEVYNENGQSTIPTSRFQQRKYNVWKAAILRNENAEGGTNNGYFMESRILVSRIGDDGEFVKRLNFVEVNGTISIAQ
jgi:hypothetical protein